MSVIIKVMKKFWGMCAVSDAKLHAAQTEPQGVARDCDQPYIDDGNKYHLIDVFYPEQAAQSLPVIIDVHGGGWMYAEKDLNRMYCLNLAKRGFVVFSMSYRLVPEVTVNEQLQDVMLSLEWIKNNLRRYPCDTEHIMLTGDSAGGQMAAYAAVLATSERLREVFRVVDCGLTFDCLLLTSPVAYMNRGGLFGKYTRLMWGSDYREKETCKYMNLDDIIDMGALPPTMLITSSGDFLARSQTRRAAEDLKKSGIPVKLMDFPKYAGKHLPHVFSILEPDKPAGIEAIDASIEFFRAAIEEKTAKRQN